MRRILTSALAFAFGLVGAFGAFTASRLAATPSHTGELLGSVDFGAYCRSVYGERVGAILTTTNGFGWKCAGRENGLFTEHDIDAMDACQRQFGRAASATLTDVTSPYSWKCVYGSG